MLIEAAAKEYLVEIEVRKFTKKTITKLCNTHFSFFIEACCGIIGLDFK